MIGKTNKMNRGKLLAAVAVLAMVFSAFAVVSVGDDADAAKVNYTSGEIKADQNYTYGTIVVVNGDLDVVKPEGAAKNTVVTVASGASFSVDTGAKMVLKSGTELIIQNGASFIVNGSLVVESGAKIVNEARYNATDMLNGEYTGFIVNGTVDLKKGGSLIGGEFKTEVSGTDTSTLSAVVDYKVTTEGTLTTTTSFTDEEISKVCVSATGYVPSYLNGVGKAGNWIALQMSHEVLGINSNEEKDVKVTYNGRTSNTSDKTDGQNFYLWLSAGTITEISMKVTDGKTMKFLVDTTNVATADTSTEPAQGMILINEGGALTSASTKVTPSLVANQEFLLSEGGKLQLSSAMNAVDVFSYTTNGVYAAGHVQISSSSVMYTNKVAAATADKEYSTLVFTTTSEKMENVFIDGETKPTGKALNMILDVSGTISGITFTVMDNKSVAGYEKDLKYGNEDGKTASSAIVYGTVSIKDNLKIGEFGTFNTNVNTITDVSGKLTASSGLESKKAVYNATGFVFVSGELKIAETDKYVTCTSIGKIIIEDTGIVDITKYTIVPDATINGAVYTVDDVTYITNLATAMTAAAAEDETVTLYGNAGIVVTDYIIGADIQITGITVTLDGNATIAEGVAVTIATDGGFEVDASNKITVKGILIDSSMDMYETGIVADVKSTDSEETYNKYTSLKNALSNAVTGETIKLFGENIKITGSMTIGEGITLDINERIITIENDSELIVDGVLTGLDSNTNLVINVASSAEVEEGKVIVNNMVVGDAIDSYNTKIIGFYTSGTVGDYKNKSFIMSAKTVSENSATIDDINVYGKANYNEITLIAGENNQGSKITFKTADIFVSKLTITGFEVDLENAFTGTIQSETSAGLSSVTFDKISGPVVKVVEDTSGETAIKTLVVYDDAPYTLNGKMIVSAGTVELGVNITTGDEKGEVLVVSEGATLVVPESIDLVAANLISGEKYSIQVLGTLDMQKGELKYTTPTPTGVVDIIGTMNVVGKTIDITGIINITGTLTISEDAEKEGKIKVSGTMFVGTAPETLGATGVVTGEMLVEGKLIAYPGSELSGAKINSAESDSKIYSVGIYINDSLYMTGYATSGNVKSFFTTDKISITGYKPVIINAGTGETATTWYKDATYEDDISLTTGVDSISAVYAKVDPQNAFVQYSVGTGISLYVDGVKVESGMTVGLSVGTHTVSASVNPGYKGDIILTFDGVAVTDGKMVITPEMSKNTTATSGIVLSATGEISIDSGASTDNGGMGITDYLLIILVVMVVILAIVVIMRMMRS